MYLCIYIHIHLLIIVHKPALSPIMISVLMCMYTRERSPTGNRIWSFCVDENTEAYFALPNNKTIWLLLVYSKSR